MEAVTEFGVAVLKNSLIGVKANLSDGALYYVWHLHRRLSLSSRSTARLKRSYTSTYHDFLPAVLEDLTSRREHGGQYGPPVTQSYNNHIVYIGSDTSLRVNTSIQIGDLKVMGVRPATRPRP